MNCKKSVRIAIYYLKIMIQEVLKASCCFLHKKLSVLIFNVQIIQNSYYPFIPMQPIVLKTVKITNCIIH